MVLHAFPFIGIVFVGATAIYDSAIRTAPQLPMSWRIGLTVPGLASACGAHKSSCDATSSKIWVTAKGRLQLTRLKRGMIEHERKFVRLFTAQERRQLLEYLQRIIFAR